MGGRGRNYSPLTRYVQEFGKDVIILEEGREVRTRGIKRDADPFHII